MAIPLGAGLLQKLDRDTLKFAMKASAVQINGVWHDVYKDPITDHGKQSKRGRLALIKDGAGRLQTIPLGDIGTHANVLRPAYRNGSPHREYGVKPPIGVILPFNTATSNNGACAMTSPLGLTISVSPVFVARNKNRPVSIARILANWAC